MSSQSSDAFWLVWSPDGLRPPKHRHSYEYQAVAEAERLARENPGSAFYVMRAIGAALVEKPAIYRTLEIPIPF